MDRGISRAAAFLGSRMFLEGKPSRAVSVSLKELFAVKGIVETDLCALQYHSGYGECQRFRCNRQVASCN